MANFVEDVPENGVKIICVGLMRSGLGSLRKALEILMCEHGGTSLKIYDQDEIANDIDKWDRVLRDEAADEAICDIYQDYDVAISMPTYIYWEKILQANPNARVILTVRNEKHWLDSVKRASEHMNQHLPGSPLQSSMWMRHIERYLVPSYHKFAEVLRFSWYTVLGMYGCAHDKTYVHEWAALSGYRHHNAYVKSCFKNEDFQDKMIKLSNGRSVRQLLVFNCEDGWDPLCEFLGVEKPVDKPFPKAQTVAMLPAMTPANDHQQHSSVMVGESPELSRVKSDPDKVWERMKASQFGKQIRREAMEGLIKAFLGVSLFGTIVTFVILASVPALILGCLSVMLITGLTYMIVKDLVVKMPPLVVLDKALATLALFTLYVGVFLTYARLKEKLIVNTKVASLVLSLFSRSIAFLLSYTVLKVKGLPWWPRAPKRELAKFAILQEVASQIGYFMLKFVSFPVQVMAKSAQLLPNMVVGQFMFKEKYSYKQYGVAIGSLACVLIMHLVGQGHDVGKKAQYIPLLGQHGTELAVFCCFSAAENISSQYQNSVKKNYKDPLYFTREHMMLGENLFAIPFTILLMLSDWSTVGPSLFEVMSSLSLMRSVLVLGLCSALGKFVIYLIIDYPDLGPAAFSKAKSSKQLLTVFQSIFLFDTGGFGIKAVKTFCVVGAFSLMNAELVSAFIMFFFIPCAGRPPHEHTE